jgi:hypothetical protein
LPNVAVTAVAAEVSTAEEEALGAVAFMAVVDLAAATMVEGVATEAIAAAGERVRCMEVAGTVEWAGARRRAALEEEEAGPRVEVLVDGPAGAGTGGT